MATTLPGSPYVESSDLVANYPAVSEALAERVDLVGVLPFASAAARTTALPTPTDGQYSYLQDTNSTEYYNGAAWVAAGVAPGLVHIATETVTAVSTISFNNVFTTDYANYRILINILGSGTAMLNMRMRASGADDTTSNYNAQYFTVFNTGSEAGRSASASSFPLRIVSELSPRSIDLFSPQIAQGTTGTNLFAYRAVTTSIEAGFIGFGHSASTSFDGFTIYPSAGTITGTIRLYGYNNI